MTPEIEKVLAEATPSLATVKIGDPVWIDFTPMADHTRSHLTQITHIDAKGRLYICSPGKDFRTGKERFGNWRYGFDPVMGVAANYSNEKMRPATQADLSARAAKEKAEQDEIAKQVERAAFERKAIDSYEADQERIRMLSEALEKLVDYTYEYAIPGGDGALQALRAHANAVLSQAKAVKL